MASVLEWTLKMKDGISGPTRAAAGSLMEFTQTLHSSLAVLDYGIQGVQALGSALTAGIAPAMQRESTLNSFTTILGDAKQAVDLYTEAVQFANKTPFETQDVVKSYKQLLAAQFKKEDLQIVATIVGDASALTEAPQQAMESVNTALGQILAKGKLSQEELNQVAEAVPLNQSLFIKNLATLTGLSEQQARAMKDAGNVSGEQGVYAVLQTLQQQFGGGMEKEAKSIRGLWSTLKSMPTVYLEKLQDTKGYEALRKALDTVTQAFDPAASRGQELGEFLNDLGSGGLERVSVMLEYASEGAAAFFDGLRAGLGPLGEAFGPTNQSNLEQFKLIMEGVGTGAASLATAFGFVSESVKSVWDYFTKIGEWWANNPELQQFLDKWVAPLTTTAPKAGSSQGTTQSRLVSEKYQEEGDFIEVPAMASGGIVSSPTLALIGEGNEREAVVPESRWPSMLPSLVTGGRGDSGTPVVTVTFNYTAASTDTSDDRAAMDIERRVEAGILQALERWALQSGRRM